jgi:thiosulfate dehydrogenase [quinone] large subunit
MEKRLMSDNPATANCFDLGATLGFLTLRLWLAVRAIVTGIEKFAGTTATDVAVEIDGAVNTYGLTASESTKAYALGNYHGVPAALYDKLAEQPLIPEAMLKIYDVVLGPALLLLGVTLLIGLCTRISLFLMGLLYTSLTVGLILLGQDGGIAWLGIHVLMIAVALFNAKHNRIQVFRKL